jgi:hypothetical protein
MQHIPSLQIPNVGLVILAPYFQPYFSRLGMLDRGSFASPDAQQRAVHLLQYCASGSIAAPENGQLLNKLLCGLPLSAELDPGAPLSERELACSAQLIHTVCQFWTAMKNASPQIFREMFMMRTGALVRSDDDWSLAVAPDRFDVLLASVPWSLSLVRLSWMEGTLRVRWK